MVCRRSWPAARAPDPRARRAGVGDHRPAEAPPLIAPPAPFTIARMPARSPGGSMGHAATAADRSESAGGIGAGLGADSPPSAPHFTPLSVRAPVFPQETGVVLVLLRPFHRCPGAGR